MSRKDSIILLSNNHEKSNIKILDDEGEEIEIEYVDENQKKEHDLLQVIKEDNETSTKEKIFKEGIFEQDDDYVVMNNNCKPSKCVEKLSNKIKLLKNIMEKNNLKQNKKNLKEEMEEIKKFYLLLVQDENSS